MSLINEVITSRTDGGLLASHANGTGVSATLNKKGVITFSVVAPKHPISPSHAMEIARAIEEIQQVLVAMS